MYTKDVGRGGASRRAVMLRSRQDPGQGRPQMPGAHSSGTTKDPWTVTVPSPLRRGKGTHRPHGPSLPSLRQGGFPRGFVFHLPCSSPTPSPPPPGAPTLRDQGQPEYAVHRRESPHPTPTHPGTSFSSCCLHPACLLQFYLRPTCSKQEKKEYSRASVWV